MKVALNPCYILHQRPYRETSLILDVFSRDHGKLSLVARGARKGRHSQRPIMQANQKLNMAWVIRGEMGTLTAIEAVGKNYNLAGRELLAAFYINELLVRLLHKQEPYPELYDAYEIALRHLGGCEDEQVILRIFEKRLLETLGYGLVLDHDVLSGEPIEASTVYYYHADSGPTISIASGHEYVKITGKALTAMANGSIHEQDDLQEAKQLTRYVLKPLLGSRPLASRELFRNYLKMRQP